MTKMRYYAASNEKIGITHIYATIGKSYIERSFVPETDIQIVDELPKDVVEIIKKVYDIQVEQWNTYLMLSVIPEPKKKEPITVEEVTTFVAKTKYLIKHNNLSLIGYSEKTLEELGQFFTKVFEEKTGITMRDSAGEESGLIPWSIIEISKYTFCEIK